MIRAARPMLAWGLCLLLGAGAVFAGLRPPDVAPGSLGPGEFTWLPEAAPAGPLLLLVSLPEQRAYLYRNGVRIAVATVSTGKPGDETPVGVYTILEKKVEHYSNLHDNAPMPFMQRLTWTGIALHAGRNPGYPASHGCIRLPEAFASRLYGVSRLGMTVVVANEAAMLPLPVDAGWLAPALPGQPARESRPEEGYWDPGRSPVGPVTIVASVSQRVVTVLRNGVEIGRSPLQVNGPAPSGIRVLQLQAGILPGESAYVPGRPRLDWRQLALAGTAGDALDPDATAGMHGRLQVPPLFARQLYDILRPGTTAIITAGAIDAIVPGYPDAPAVDPREATPGPATPEAGPGPVQRPR